MANTTLKADEFVFNNDEWCLVPKKLYRNVNSGGTKSDEDKPRVDLLDAEFLEEMGKVMGHGAKKYSPSNWRGGIAISRFIASSLRHILAIMRGEDIDSESNLSHAAHLGCNAQFLNWTLKHKPELDDRWKG